MSYLLARVFDAGGAVERLPEEAFWFDDEPRGKLALGAQGIRLCAPPAASFALTYKSLPQARGKHAGGPKTARREAPRPSLNLTAAGPEFRRTRTASERADPHHSADVFGLRRKLRVPALFEAFPSSGGEAGWDRCLPKTRRRGGDVPGVQDDEADGTSAPPQSRASLRYAQWGYDEPAAKTLSSVYACATPFEKLNNRCLFDRARSSKLAWTWSSETKTNETEILLKKTRGKPEI
jgi:hypothetical protein